MHVVLFQPEIPENTGAIGRTCVAAGVKLHLVRPLGFQLDASDKTEWLVDVGCGLNLYDHICYETL